MPAPKKHAGATEVTVAFRRVEREVLAVGQSRKVESHWVDTTVRHAESGEPAAKVLLHSGVFKASYADYPTDRLA